MMRGKIALFAALFSILWCMGLSAVHGDIRTDALFSEPMDHHKYVAMAEGSPGAFRIAPFCWRVGAPFLASLLAPNDVWMGFSIVAIVGIVLASAAIALFVWDRVGSFSAVLGAVLTFHALGWLVRFSVWDPATTDALAVGLMSMGLYAFSRKWMVTGAALALAAVLTKESALIGLLAVPLLFERPRWRTTAVWYLPAVVSLIAVRLVIPAGNEEPAYLMGLSQDLTAVQNGVATYSLPYLVEAVTIPRLTNLGVGDVYAMTLDSFGAIVVIGCGALFMFRSTKRWQLALVISAALAQTLFAVNIQRPLLIAAPILVIETWSGIPWARTRGNGWILVALSSIITVFAAILHRVSPSAFVQGACLVAGLLYVVMVRGDLTNEVQSARSDDRSL